MALVDPNIALSFKGIQLKDPLEQYGRVAAIQQAQNQNALAQYQLGAAQRTEQRELARMNELALAGSDETKIGNALLRAGDIKGYMDFQKSISERQTQELTRRKTLGEIELQPGQKAKQQQELVDARLKQARQFLDTIDPTDPNAPEKYMAWHEANHADPVLGPVLASRGVTAEQSRAQIQNAIAQGPGAFADLLNKSKLGTERFMELNKPTVTSQNLGGTTRLVQTPGLGGTATVVPGSTATVTPPPAPTEIQRLINERNALPAGDPRIEIYNKAIVKASTHSPGTTVNLPPQEKAEQSDRGKFLVEQYKGISDAARIGARSLPALQSNIAILDKGFETGFGTEAKAAGAKVLAALGVKDAEKYATDAQTFLGNASAAVLQRQLEQKGPQTEADAQRITQTGAQLGNTKEANKFFINVARAQINRDIDQRNFYDKWWKTNKTYDGAEDAWYAGEGGKSLFERPELKSSVQAPSIINQIPTGRAPTPAVARPAAAPTPIPQAAIDALKAKKGTPEQFDEIFGAGAAKRVLGGK